MNRTPNYRTMTDLQLLDHYWLMDSKLSVPAQLTMELAKRLEKQIDRTTYPVWHEKHQKIESCRVLEAATLITDE